MKLNFARVAALGPIGIGVLFTVLSGGCAAGAGEPNTGSSEPVGKSTQATITPVSFTTTGGCSGVGAFNIQSPQVISFIAANTSAFQNVQMQLFQQTQQGTMTQVNTQVQAANAQFQAMLNQSAQAATSQEAKLNQAASASAMNSATTAASATEQDQTQISGSQSSWQNSNSTVIQHNENNASAQGTASNTAAQSALATNSANGNSGSSNNAAQNFMNTAFQLNTVPAFFGGIGLLPITNSSSSSQNNTTGAASNAFFTNAAAAAQQAAAAQNSAFNTSSHHDNTSVNQTNQQSAQGSQFQQDFQHQMQAANGTAVQNSAANASNLNSDQLNTTGQSSQSNLQQSGQNSSGSSTQVMNNLDTLNWDQFTLMVNLTATQANNILQLFQGSNGVVTNTQAFPINLPACTIN